MELFGNESIDFLAKGQIGHTTHYLEENLQRQGSCLSFDKSHIPNVYFHKISILFILEETIQVGAKVIETKAVHMIKNKTGIV